VIRSWLPISPPQELAAWPGFVAVTWTWFQVQRRIRSHREKGVEVGIVGVEFQRRSGAGGHRRLSLRVYAQLLWTAGLGHPWRSDWCTAPSAHELKRQPAAGATIWLEQGNHQTGHRRTVDCSGCRGIATASSTSKREIEYLPSCPSQQREGRLNHRGSPTPALARSCCSKKAVSGPRSSIDLLSGGPKPTSWRKVVRCCAPSDDRPASPVRVIAPQAHRITFVDQGGWPGAIQQTAHYASASPGHTAQTLPPGAACQVHGIRKSCFSSGCPASMATVVWRS